MTNYQAIKQQLFEACKTYVNQRIAMAQKGIQDAQNAANDETKSSVGDKYETGRAMMHLEKDKYALQLSEALQLQQQLSTINISEAKPNIGQSSLVKTDKGIFFIAISIGKVVLENDTFFAISLAAPLGKAFYQKKKGDAVHFRGSVYQILSVI